MPKEVGTILEDANLILPNKGLEEDCITDTSRNAEVIICSRKAIALTSRITDPSFSCPTGTNY